MWRLMVRIVNSSAMPPNPTPNNIVNIPQISISIFILPLDAAASIRRIALGPLLSRLFTLQAIFYRLPIDI